MLSERTRLRLQDIIEDADRIAVFIDGVSLYEFRGDERTLFAIERLLQRITEAAIQIEPADASKLGAHMPVAEMRAFGNRLRHEYRNIDPAVVFDVARINVPSLRAAAELALEAWS